MQRRIDDSNLRSDRGRGCHCRRAYIQEELGVSVHLAEVHRHHLHIPSQVAADEINFMRE